MGKKVSESATNRLAAVPEIWKKSMAFKKRALFTVESTLIGGCVHGTSSCRAAEDDQQPDQRRSRQGHRAIPEHRINAIKGQTDRQTDVRTARAAKSCRSGPSAWSRRLVMATVMTTTHPLGGHYRGSGTSLPSSHTSLGPWAWRGVRGHGLVMTAERRWWSSWQAVVWCGGEMMAQDGQSRWMRRRRREDRGRGEVRYRVLRKRLS
ncbi:hypothetical protein JOL62DRAFT_154391 [Phyllosticta paracitricarpa]|uniref:Uncharacterized protein n=1 Tax=Phyllosticta paracitricarpa TaxID=2016321 RepID=A0ABR1N498_9PEZI